MAVAHVEANSELSNDALAQPEGSKVMNTKEATAEKQSKLEDTIISEIRKLQNAKKRANSTSIAQNLTKQLGLAGSVVSLKLSEMIATGKIITKIYRGKETFRLPKVPSWGFSDSELSESEVDDNDEVSEEDQQLNRSWSDPEPQPATPTFGEMVTIPVTVLSNLSKSLNLANEMLHNERQITQNLWKENQDLKLKLENHKDTTTRNTAKPLETPSSIVIEDSVIGNNSNNKRTFVQNRSKRQRAKPNNNRNSGLANAKSNKKESSSDQNRNDPSQTTSRARAELTKKNAIIVGDSQLRNIDGAKLSNEHFNVTVKPMPGARIARMKNVNYADADVVIVHAGTCNLKKQSDPEELADEIVSTLRDLKSKGNKAQVAFSGIIKRKDDLELNAKAIKTNEIIVEKLMYSGFDFIDNNQIKYGYLARDGLHINDGGVRKLAANFSHYIRY